MDLNELRSVADAIATVVRDAPVGVVAVGAGTQQEIGNPLPRGLDAVRVPAGAILHEPDDLTVTVSAGTSYADLRTALAERGQEVPLDPRDPSATVGGILAAGLSGTRRLRVGPVRDTVLEVRFVDGTGTLVKGGGPTVKNVSGYDLCRLLVGSLGTLGVLVRVTLRCRPLPAAHAWFHTEREPDAVRSALLRPSSVLAGVDGTHVLLEGVPADVDAEAHAGTLGAPVEGGPTLPTGAHRGRISVDPTRLDALCRRLDAVAGLRRLAEYGVGTVHVAGDDPAVLVDARRVAVAHGGWLLREQGGPPGFDAFGAALPNRVLAARVKRAFDPQFRLAPGRMPL